MDYVEDPYVFLKFQRNVMTAFAVWPKKKQKYDIAYKLYSVLFTYLISILFTLSMILDIVFNITNIELVTAALYFMITQMNFVIKLTIFTMKRKMVKKILVDLKEELFIRMLPEHLSMRERYLKPAVVFAYYYIIQCYIVIIFYGIYPIIEKDEVNVLPFRGWFPFDIYKNVTYRSYVYIFQLIALVISVAVNVSLDTMAITLIQFSCWQINILKNNLVNVSRRAVKNVSGDDENVSLIKRFDLKQKSFDDEIDRMLSDSVRHHVSIKGFVRDVEHIFGMGIFFQFMSSGIIICITGFYILLIPFGSLQFITLIGYFYVMLMQLFAYCYTGHQLIVESTDIGDSCFNSDWYDCSKKINKIIFVMMERAKEPMKITAGKFFALSINTFMTILRSSYSFFAVLQRVNTD